jgi:hypothetical protein
MLKLKMNLIAKEIQELFHILISLSKDYLRETIKEFIPKAKIKISER